MGARPVIYPMNVQEGWSGSISQTDISIDRTINVEKLG
jgi:hypothetical protein